MSTLQKVEIAGDSFSSVNIPEHLIIDNILPRLPVKTLIRFKSVSKSWFSTISSPQFVKSHLDCSSSSSSGQFLLLVRHKDKNKDRLDYRMSIKLMLLAYDELNNLKTPVDLGFPLSFKPNMQWINIVGCSNGLVCLRITSLFDDKMGNSLLYVYNLATRENRKILGPDGWQQWQGWLLYRWFGYVPSVDDYCIVASFYGDNGCTMCVYFLRIGKWQIIKDVNGYLRSVSMLCLTTVFDGVLYWSLEGISSENRPERIIAIDLVNVQWKEFPWMDWLNKYDVAHFVVLHGCLSLLCRSNSCHQIGDVWRLKKHGDWSCWEKLCCIHIGDMDYITSVNSTGKFMLRRYTNNQFKLVGLSKDTKQLSQGDVYFSKEEIMSAVRYVESLVSPFGTIKSNKEEDRDESNVVSYVN